MMTLRPAVRAGLVRLLAAPDAWPAADPFIFRNRLLDECSSDALPLVRLVLRAGELGFPERIRRAQREGKPWEPARAPLVLQLVEELFVQSEVAQWVVDTWAIALGVTREAPPVPASVAANASRRSVAAAPRGTPRPRTGAAPAARGAVRPAALQVATLPAPLPATRRPMTPMPAASQVVLRSPIFWIGGLLMVVAVVIAGARIRQKREGLRTPELAGAPPAASAPRPGAAPPSAVPTPGVASLTPSQLPGVGPDRRGVLAVTPATRPNMPAGPGATAIVAREVGADGIPGSPTALPRNASAAERRPDRIELRAGRVLTGRVELVRPSVIIFQEWESGLRFELPKADIAAIVTEFGTTVRFNTEGTPANEKRLPLVKRGVGGLYVASYRPLDVRGSPECRTIFGPTMSAERVTVTHVPGADTLTMLFESGKRFATVIDGVGQFATSFAIAEGQARTSTALTTRLEGRFGSEGFDGTTHIIAFRRSATSGGDLSCYAQIATTAIRQAAGMAGR